MKWFFRILRWFVFLVIVLIVAGMLLWNPMLKAFAEKGVRNATGMDTQIGNFSMGLLTPTLTVENLKIYNPPDFGGTPFLNIRELHVEYDRNALQKHILHITLLRLNLDENDVVKNQAGRTNIVGILSAMQANKPGGGAKAVKRLAGFQFTGIDVLNVSVGKARFIDLKNQNLNRWVDISLENQIIKNVKSPADLAGLGALIWLRGGYTVGLPVIPPKHDAGGI